jgi:uncharacterized DUF497 family protein
MLRPSSGIPSRPPPTSRSMGVPFEEAATVFQDAMARIPADPHHSASESREILIGHSAQGGLMLVAFTDRQGRLRRISAREVTRRERREYAESQQGRSRRARGPAVRVRVRLLQGEEEPSTSPVLGRRGREERSMAGHDTRVIACVGAPSIFPSAWGSRRRGPEGVSGECG